eukprot:gene22907-29084_t
MYLHLGEEEAIFSWAATNFLMGSLLPSSTGGGLISEANRTYGTLDLSDSSAQIAFYVPSSQNDKTDGLFNLQIGNQKHWNVYTKSFLQFGMVSARTRHLTDLVDHFLDSNPVQSSGTRVPASAGSSSSPLNYCFHAGYSENAVDSTGVRTVEVSGPLMPLQDQLTRCTQSVRELMERKFGRFCSEHNHGDCTIGGAYQPALSGETFVGHSSYRFPWKFLLMPRTADLQMFRSRAELICSMNFGDLLFYFESHNLGADPNQLNLHLPYYCFMASFVLVLLQDGFRFKSDQMLTVLDDVPGSSAGWSLGAMLHEINDMSWEQQQMHQQQHHLLPTGALHSGHHPWGLVVIGSLLGFALGGVAAVCIYKEVVEDKGQQERGGSGTGGGDYDYESLSRLTAMELLEAHAVGGAGAVYKHKSGSSSVAGQSSSPVSGSPSNATMRKSSSSAVSSPYASPTKTGHRRPSATSFGASTGIAETEHGAGSAGGNALFKNMADFRPFQRSAPDPGVIEGVVATCFVQTEGLPAHYIFDTVRTCVKKVHQQKLSRYSMVDQVACASISDYDVCSRWIPPMTFVPVALHVNTTYVQIDSCEVLTNNTYVCHSSDPSPSTIYGNQHLFPPTFDVTQTSASVCSQDTDCLGSFCDTKFHPAICSPKTLAQATGTGSQYLNVG